MFKLKLLLILLLFFVGIAYTNEQYVESLLLEKIYKKYKIYAKKDFCFFRKLLIM